MMMSKTVRFPHDRVAKKDRTLEKKHVLNRSVAGTIKRLNELFRGENVEKVIFSPDARLLRYKLKESLLQLMFMEPEEYGQRAEELIWSKVFYSVIVKMRQCTRQGVRVSSNLELYYRNHLLQGIGFYQDLSLRLQNNYNLRLHKGIDFARPPPTEIETARHGLSSNLYLGCGLLDTTNVDSYDEEELIEQRQKRLKKWATEAVHRCLICMGDLTRYQHDFFRDNGAGRCIATRYYSQALLLLPAAGLPFNQLAALDAASGHFHMLFAVYDYWRCLSAEVPFEGARQNLVLLLERNAKRYLELSDAPPPAGSAPPNFSGPTPPVRQMSEEQTRVKDVKKLIIKFLALTQKFSKTKHEQGDILPVAKDVLTEMDMCMFAVRGLSCRFGTAGEKSEDNMLIVHDLSRPKHLPDAVVFRCLVICIAVWHQLCFHSSSNFAGRVVQAFIMSFFSIVLNQAVSRMQFGLKDALGLDEPAFALPSPGSSDEAEDAPPAEKVNHFGAVGERLDRGTGISRRRRRTRRPAGGESEALGSEDEEEDVSEDEVEQDDSASNNSSEGRNSFLVEESEEEDEDEDDYFLMDISTAAAQEHRPSLGFGASGELQAVPEEVASNGGGSGTGASQEAAEEWGTEAVRALKELKERLMLESGDASSRLLPFLAASHHHQPQQQQQPSGGARQVPFDLAASMADDNVEEGSDEAFCREVSMKVANFSIENDNEVPPEDDEETPAGCFIETWPEECAADLLLQQQMEEEASRGELLARRFTIIGKTDLLWCSTLMEAFIRVADIESDGEGIPLALLGHFATLLNMLNHVDEAIEKGAIQLRPEIKLLAERRQGGEAGGIGESRFSAALAEDQQLRGFTPLRRFHEGLDFGLQPSSIEEEALIRADRLLALGHRLAAQPKIDFSFDAVQGVFLGPSSLRPTGIGAAISALESGTAQGQSPQPEEEAVLNGFSHSGTVGQRRFAANEARRNRLMQDMAQLRLKSEIERLEASVESAPGLGRPERPGDLGLLPPYLLPHTQVLCTHLGAVRRLVQARRFIVVVPEAVVDHLDLLKKQEPRAREVIRFLESESHRGNCFLRLQRHSEQISGGQSEAPRRVWSSKLRGPEAEWNRWASMLCGARYFARQAGPPASARGLVALLWTEGGNVAPSVQEEAANEGILTEFFPEFYSKWKQTREKG